MAVRALVPLARWLAVVAALLLLPAAARAADAPSREVPVIELSGTIDPATAGWVNKALNDAREERAPLAIVRVDTPGGLSESMREIVQAILRAPMPVVVHVALAVELLSPGLVGPGVFGAVALLLGLYGTAQLPVTAAGIVLLVVGVAFLAAELAVASSGVMASAGAIALAFAGLLLYDTDSQAFAVSLPVAATVGASLGLVTVFALGKALALRRAPPRGGTADLIGAIATARTALEPDGHVAVAGELWRARVSDDEPVTAGERVRVAAVDGLTLSVRPTTPDTTKEGS